MERPTPRPVLDSGVIESLRNLGGPEEPELFVELVDLFLADAANLVDSLSRAIEQSDTKLLERTAHTLKSSSANIGACALSLMCSEIETLCRKSQFEGARGWVERAVTHYEHVQAALLAEKAR